MAYQTIDKTIDLKGDLGHLSFVFTPACAYIIVSVTKFVMNMYLTYKTQVHECKYVGLSKILFWTLIKLEKPLFLYEPHFLYHEDTQIVMHSYNK